MIKNLIYGALAATGVAAAATVAVMATASSEPTPCTVTLDANGGTFGSTNVYSVPNIEAGTVASNVLNKVRIPTYVNHDFEHWAVARNDDIRVPDDALIVSSTNYYAKWKLSDIQSHEITNYNGASVFDGVVEKFPVAFHGKATVGRDAVIKFKVPEAEDRFRVSLDPTGEWSRVCATITVVQTNDHVSSTETFTIGKVTSSWSLPYQTIPVNFGPTNIFFYKDACCEIKIHFTEGDWPKDEPDPRYILGIGLGYCQVKFDAGDYGYIYDDTVNRQFKTYGANLTTNLPFGYLPEVEQRIAAATFVGWFTDKRGGEQLTKDALVGTNNVYHAHWNVKYKYTVEFKKNGIDVKGTMDDQEFSSGEAKALPYNRYYRPQYKFKGWARSAKGSVEYSDGQVVSNLTDVSETISLHACWEPTPNENHFTVSSGITNFVDVAVSNLVTYVNGTASTPAFMLTVTNSATLRVSIDPKAGSDREGAKLSVYKEIVGGWSNVCEVTDMATTNTTYLFEEDTTYRFNVTGASANYGYVVGLGAVGKQISYDPCCTNYVNKSTLSKALSFNWTVDTPYGYLPTLTSAYGDLLGWFYDKDITHTNQVNKSELVVSNATFYAHWSKQPYYIEFDGKGATNPTNTYVQGFRYGEKTTLLPNQYYKEYHCFLGWDTNSIATNSVYLDCASVSNLCTVAGGTNRLYAVWKKTPGENHYVLSQGVTNFVNVAVATNVQAFFHGNRNASAKEFVKEFQMTLTNRTETAVRVSLDPDLYGVTTNTAVQTNAMLRTGATLDVYRWDEGITNWAKNACCHVSDLQEEEQLCCFTNATYRFAVTATYPYVVGLGLKGEQVNFDPCGGSVDKTKSASDSLTFNWTVDTPYGYLPTVKPAHDGYGDFMGWYDSADRATSNRIVEVSIVADGLHGTNTVYARWQNVPDCWIAFDPVLSSYSGEMEPQGFIFNDKSKRPLNRNRYSAAGYIFQGWDTSRAATTVRYVDGESVYASNIVEKVGTTNYLYAVWEAGYEYEIDEEGKDLGEITLSPTVPTYISGSGEATSCTFTVSEKATNCRVAVDPGDGYGNPEEGYGRRNVTLTILYAPKPEESEDGEEEEEEEEPAWSTTNLCVVSDLSDHEVRYTFSTAYRYKFALSNAPEDYGYVVSVGAEGAQYTFETCGGEIDEDEAMSTSLTFNWTVGSPLGYLHPMKDSEYLGTCLGWSYSPDVRDEEEDPDEKGEDASEDDEEEEEEEQEEEEEKEIEDEASYDDPVASTNTTLYAWWSDAQAIAFTFDWNLPDENGSETNLTTKYYGEFTPICLYAPNQTKGVPTPTCKGWGFLGWTTDAEGTEGWEISSFTVSTNSPTYFYAQWTDEWKTERLTNGVVIVGKNGMIGGEMVIPDAIKPCPLPVVSVADGAFSNRTDLTKLTISTNVTYVGNSAFEDCTSLAEVVYPTKAVKDEYARGGYLAKIVGEVDEDGQDPVELGTNVFCGCTALTSVQLPLGLMIVPDGCFSGCTALKEFTTPYTVLQIGERAFYRCTHLQTVELPEIVADLYSEAFGKCARMKLVKFLGDMPNRTVKNGSVTYGDVSGDIFKGTQRNMLVAYFENMSLTNQAYCGGSWLNLPNKWPSGDYARTLTWLASGKYPRRKVTFNMNDGETPAVSSKEFFLYHLERDFGLLAPTKEDLQEMNYSNYAKFSGWWTQPVGGRRVGNYRKVTGNMTVYAHWDGNEGNDEIGSRSGEDYPVSWPGTAEDLSKFSGFYSEEDDMFYYSASTFNGIVIDMTNVQNGTNTLAGTVAFTFAEGGSSSDGMQSPFTAVITWNDGSTVEIPGYANAEGCLVSGNGQWSFGEGENACMVTKSGIYGNLYDGASGTTYRIYAARNRYAMSTDASRDIVLTALQATRGTWHVVLRSEACASKFSNGYTTLAVVISGMGEATVVGTTADGTWLSVTSKLVIGDGCCCLPVTLQYPGGGGFAFMLWFTWQSDGSFDESDASVQGLTQWTTPTFTTDFVEVLPLTFIDEKLYEGEADFLAEDELGTNVLATIMMEGAAWTVQPNDYWLELSYDSQTGTFSGSFQAKTEGGQTAQATVHGVFTDRITTDDATVTEYYWGYGTAVIPGVGSVPVEIATE